jgi:hypothetical protein
MAATSKNYIVKTSDVYSAGHDIDLATVLNNIDDKLTPHVVTIDTADAGTITLADNTIYNAPAATELTSIEIVLAASYPIDMGAQLNFSSGVTATEFIAPVSGILWYGDDLVSDVFVPQANVRYNILFYSDGAGTIRAIVQGV